MINYIRENFSHFDHIQKSIKKIALEMDIPIIRDSMVLYIESLFSLYKVKNILELGSGLAYSTYTFAKYSPKECKITSVDLSVETIERSKTILKASNYIEKIKWIHSDALEYLKNNSLKKYDFFFIDALKSDYLNYFKEIIEQIEHGVILLDNLYMDGEVENKNSIRGREMHYFNKLLYQFDGKVTLLPIGDGVGLFVK